MSQRILLVTGEGQAAQALVLFCKRAFESLGISCDSFIYHSRRPFIKKLLFFKIAHFRPQILFVIKGEKLTPKILKDLKREFEILLVNWWVDDPVLLSASRKISPFYDYFFTCDPPSIPVHQLSDSSRVSSLTVACDPSLHRTVPLTDQERSYYGSDIAFVGQMTSARADTFRDIADLDFKIWCARDYCNFDGENTICRPVPQTDPLYQRFTGVTVWYEEMVKVYNASKMVVNTHSHGRVATTTRPFEAMGCGTFLVSEYRPELDNFFKIGKDLICFKEPRELRQLVVHYLKEDEERREIAFRGQQAVTQKHTYRHRMKELLDCIHD